MLEQEPLFKMQYEYICDECHKSYKGKQKSTTYIRSDWEEKQICKKCVKEMLENKMWIFYKWKLYNTENSNVHHCNNCSKYFYLEDVNTPFSEYYCNICNKRRWKEIEYCSICWKVHEKEWGICTWWLHNELWKIKQDNHINFTDHKASKTWWLKWQVKYKTEFFEELKKLPFQEERELEDWIKYDLNDFYSYEEDEPVWDFWIDNYYYWQPVEITWEVSYKRYSWLNKFAEKIKDIERYNWTSIKNWYKQSKYRNHFFKDISDDWLITREYVDMMWNIKEKKESINKFFEDNWMDIDKVSLSKKIYYRLSSDINHKCKSFRANERLGSCQQDHNCKTYASWAYDAITNWCNCPILLFNNKDDMYVKAEDMKNEERPIWRITSRIMYDKDWKTYILIDRLYQDWSLSSDILKWNIYKAIILDLKSKWYNVIVTNYSAHDESTLQYIRALWIKNTEVVENLYQPLRRLYDIEWEDWVCWYYSDWWIDVLGVEINNIPRATDYLDKAYLIKD